MFNKALSNGIRADAKMHVNLPAAAAEAAAALAFPAKLAAASMALLPGE